MDLMSFENKPSRQGRYRKLLMLPEKLVPIAAILENIFQELNQFREQGRLSDAEFLSYGLLTLLACRRPHAFQSDKSQIIHKASTAYSPSSFHLPDFWELLEKTGLPLPTYQKLFAQKLSVDQFLMRFRLRGIPDSARMALLEWLSNRYPLTLFFHIPSGIEVFELQKKGGRCVSFFKQAQALTEHHQDRDVLSFIVHDLIHAHEFYAHPQRARQQIGFYHWLDTIQNHPQLLKLIETSPGFFERWEYVLSDMNSYCGHLLKTLHAAFTIHAHPGEGESLWQRVVEASGLAPEEKRVFLKVNSPQWGEADFLHLESVLEKMHAHHSPSAILANTMSFLHTA